MHLTLRRRQLTAIFPVGSGAIDMGAKAMVHTIAGAARGFPIKSIGSLSELNTINPSGQLSTSAD